MIISPRARRHADAPPSNNMNAATKATPQKSLSSRWLKAPRRTSSNSKASPASPVNGKADDDIINNNSEPDSPVPLRATRSPPRSPKSGVPEPPPRASHNKPEAVLSQQLWLERNEGFMKSPPPDAPTASAERLQSELDIANKRVHQLERDLSFMRKTQRQSSDRHEEQLKQLQGRSEEVAAQSQAMQADMYLKLRADLVAAVGGAVNNIASELSPPAPPPQPATTASDDVSPQISSLVGRLEARLEQTEERLHETEERFKSQVEQHEEAARTLVNFTAVSSHAASNAQIAATARAEETEELKALVEKAMAEAAQRDLVAAQAAEAAAEAAASATEAATAARMAAEAATSNAKHSRALEATAGLMGWLWGEEGEERQSHQASRALHDHGASEEPPTIDLATAQPQRWSNHGRWIRDTVRKGVSTLISRISEEDEEEETEPSSESNGGAGTKSRFTPSPPAIRGGRVGTPSSGGASRGDTPSPMLLAEIRSSSFENLRKVGISRDASQPLLQSGRPSSGGGDSGGSRASLVAGLTEAMAARRSSWRDDSDEEDDEDEKWATPAAAAASPDESPRIVAVDDDALLPNLPPLPSRPGACPQRRPSTRRMRSSPTKKVVRVLIPDQVAAVERAKVEAAAKAAKAATTSTTQKASPHAAAAPSSAPRAAPRGASPQRLAVARPAVGGANLRVVKMYRERPRLVRFLVLLFAILVWLERSGCALEEGGTLLQAWPWRWHWGVVL